MWAAPSCCKKNKNFLIALFSGFDLVLHFNYFFSICVRSFVCQQSLLTLLPHMLTCLSSVLEDKILVSTEWHFPKIDSDNHSVIGRTKVVQCLPGEIKPNLSSHRFPFIDDGKKMLITSQPTQRIFLQIHFSEFRDHRSTTVRIRFYTS